MAKARATKQAREVLDPDNELDVEIEDGETETGNQREGEPRINTDEHGSEVGQNQQAAVVSPVVTDSTGGTDQTAPPAAAFKELMTEITEPTRLDLPVSDCASFNIGLTVPVSVDDTSGFLPRHLNVRLEGRQARMLKRIYQALHAGSHRRSNGQHVDKLNHVIQWILDRVIVASIELEQTEIGSNTLSPITTESTSIKQL